MTIKARQSATFAATAVVVSTGIIWYMTNRFPLQVEADATGHFTKIVTVAGLIGIVTGLTVATWVGHWLTTHPAEKPFDKLDRLVREGKIVRTPPTRSGWFDYVDREGNFLFGSSQAPPDRILNKY